jgi:hypothetical protein
MSPGQWHARFVFLSVFMLPIALLGARAYLRDTSDISERERKAGQEVYSALNSRGIFHKEAAKRQKPLIAVCGMDGGEITQRSVDLHSFSEKALLADFENHLNVGQ